MNIAKMESSKKEHWQNGVIHGSRTACKRKTSGVGSNGNEGFKWTSENHPEVCCTICLSRFQEYQNRKQKKISLETMRQLS